MYSYAQHREIRISDLKNNTICETLEDSGGTGGRYIHLLSGTMELKLNYRTIILNNQLKTSQKEFLYPRFYRNSTLRLAGRVEMRKGLALLTWVVAEVPEGYLHCGGIPPRSMRPKP